jgi:tetratricopeptide (TPR) repeat protein
MDLGLLPWNTAGMNKAESQSPRRVRYVPVVGRRLKGLLYVVFGLFAVLGVNSIYLVTISLRQWSTGETYENYFYQWMFLCHLVLGLLIIAPVVFFGAFHLRNAWNRPNRRAVRAGLALFTTSLVVLASGVLLTRAFVDLREPTTRATLYWVHVASPVVAVWLFILHRLAGRRIRWTVGLSWVVVAAVFALGMTLLHHQDPRRWNEAGPASGLQYFFPSLSRTASGNFIPAATLLNDAYCRECHADIHASWLNSVHRLSSFNNPAYEASVRETRRVVFERDGTVQGSRFCAGCHDPVPFFSGDFEDDRFDDPDYDLASDEFANAGITCTSCHAITHINSVRGNADYTIEEPIHYPFAFSENPVMQWVNQQLVKAKPGFHKKTFLKPLHKTAEFCAACHKVHLPQELNHYKFLRGQNHYDTYLLSGVSGHGVASFYYPPKAVHNCSECHMPLMASEDFGAAYFEEDPLEDLFGELAVHDHQFPSANTAVPFLVGRPDETIEAHREFLEGVMRVDIFGVKAGGTIEGDLTAPIRPEVPVLEPGGRYLVETVIRTVKMGHLFTEGTADSNEVWLDVTVRSGDRTIGRSGGMAGDGEVDPWSHFVNAFVLDREGNRIDRRNAQDIFVPLYNNQIPPGAADVVHYALTVPPDVSEPVTIDVALRFRKFDTTYARFFQADAFDGNDLPIITLATDRVTLPVSGSAPANESSPVEDWERWNDYGIGLLRKGDFGASKGELRQAEDAFARVGALGRPDGPLNTARVYLKEGRLEEAVTALQEAAAFDPPAPSWSVAWFTGLVNKQNGFLDQAIEDFTSIVTMDTEETRLREFDFSQDYRLLNELGQTIFERAKQERGEEAGKRRRAMLREAESWFTRALEIDPENVTAHYNLGLLYSQLADEKKADKHRELHARYKPDDNARDRAVAAARRQYPAADHAANAIVIYDLQRPGTYEYD